MLNKLIKLNADTSDKKLLYNIDDYIDRAHARSTTAENWYLPCAHARLSQCGIAIVRAQIGRLNRWEKCNNYWCC